MTEQEFLDLEPRERDALVAERVMGLKVIPERLTVVFVEGEASVHIDSSPEGWACYAETGPVYIDDFGHDWPPPDEKDFEDYPEMYARDLERYNKDIERFGVPHHLLYAVDWSTSEIAHAWQVVEKMRSEGWNCAIDDLGFGNEMEGVWRARFDKPENVCFWADSEQAETAWCIAALKARGVIG